MERRTLLGAMAAGALGAGMTGLPVERTDWQDDARRRAVPVLIRRPATPGPAPLVLLSHGLGGSREGLAYLGLALAAAGYICVHLQHAGSDAGVWQGAPDTRAAMLAAAKDPGAALARLRDIIFALDHITAGAEGLAIDPARIAIAGHSYGAWTASHMLGERLPLLGAWLRLPDRRLRAGIALSPIPPLVMPAALSYGAITAPILHVTGTEDRGYGVTDWHERTVAYRRTAAPGVLAVLGGARHAAFAGEAVLGGYWNDPTYQPRTAMLCRLFLDAVLRDDSAARASLASGAGLAPGDTVESKEFA